MSTLCSYIDSICSFLHYLDLTALIYVKLDVSWKNVYFSRLQTSLVFIILNGTAKTKLAMLAFLCCQEFMKNSIRCEPQVKKYKTFQDFFYSFGVECSFLNY